MPPKLSVRSVESYIRIVQTRMPFRYGSAKLVRCPHLYLLATVEDQQGHVAQGIAADNLPPLWFDKDPMKSYPRQLEDQLRVISWAASAAQAEAPNTAFRLWLGVYRATQEQARAAGLPVLLGGFGPSLVERAVNDAGGHLLDLPFHTLLRSNALGIEPELIDPSLRGVPMSAVLPDRPLDAIAARHTIGLSDPIRADEIPPEERLTDGLPQSLDEVVAFYGVTYFKIKVSNQLEVDLDRLAAIAAILDEQLPDVIYRSTLDGNEQYGSMEELLPLLGALESQDRFRRLRESILFIEQPVARSAALDADRLAGMERIPFPVIIDESDDGLESYSRALELGYRGTSHKNCKNTFKSVINLARTRQAMQSTGHPRLLSAEDLTNIGAVALQQDLVALSALGITHAERNGQHYFRGLSHLSASDQQKALLAHPDLYCAYQEGARVDIRQGEMACRGLHQTPGLGVPIRPDLSGLIPAEEFVPASEF